MLSAFTRHCSSHHTQISESCTVSLHSQSRDITVDRQVCLRCACLLCQDGDCRTNLRWFVTAALPDQGVTIALPSQDVAVALPGQDVTVALVCSYGAAQRPGGSQRRGPAVP